MASMTRDQAKAIYKARYWTEPRLYLLAPVSAEVAGELFDTGVNMGPKVAAKFLQRGLNALNRCGRDYLDVVVDGSIGPKTVEALKALLAKRGAAGRAALLKAVNSLQGAHYVQLAEAREANEAFLLGWLNNRTTA